MRFRRKPATNAEREMKKLVSVNAFKAPSNNWMGGWVMLTDLPVLFVQPVKSLDEMKPAGGPGRGSFNQLNKKREMRMADLPPMPGG